MIPAPFKVLLDANALFPLSLRDTLLRAAAAGFFQLYWSRQSIDEARRNLVTSRTMTPEKAYRLRGLGFDIDVFRVSAHAWSIMSSQPPNAVTGVLHGTTITLDKPVPPLDGHRVRVIVEPEDEELELSPAENTALLREWVAQGPQGPIEDDDDFPDSE